MEHSGGLSDTVGIIIQFSDTHLKTSDHWPKEGQIVFKWRRDCWHVWKGFTVRQLQACDEACAHVIIQCQQFILLLN